MQAIKRLREVFEARVAQPLKVRKARRDFESSIYSVTDADAAFRQFVTDFPDAVRWKDRNGTTILHFAAQCRDAAFCAWLVDRGADVNAANKASYTPLHYAAQCAGNDPTAALQVLLERGATIEARNMAGETPLMFAVNRNKPWNAKVLVLAGADPKACAHNWDTPLSVAEKYPGGEMLAALREGMEERARLGEEAMRRAMEAQQQAQISATVAVISGGLEAPVSVRSPLRLKR